jgi:hypothetical protein
VRPEFIHHSAVPPASPSDAAFCPLEVQIEKSGFAAKLLMQNGFATMKLI